MLDQSVIKYGSNPKHFLSVKTQNIIFNQSSIEKKWKKNF